MTSVLRAIPYVIHRPVLRLIIMFFRVRVHYTRKTAAKVLLFFDMTKFFCKKILSLLIFRHFYVGIGRYKAGLTRKGNTDAICGEGSPTRPPHEGEGKNHLRLPLKGRDRSERDVFGGNGCRDVILRGSGGLLGGFEFAVDRDVRVLVKTGIGFHAGFGGGAAFDYTEIMTEETKAPFERGKGVVVLESMSDLLGGFDEVAVLYAGSGPGLGEMVGVELVEFAAPARSTAEDDVFVVMAAFLTGVHDTIIHVNAERELQIANSATVGGGDFGVWDIARNDAIQTVFYYGFQVLRHDV